jgi:hypothetical protein
MSPAGGALAAGPSLSLEFKGQYVKRNHTACGKAKRFRLFHRNATIEFRGFLTPPSIKHFPVRLELKRCVGGHWLKLGDRFVLGKRATGKYKGFFGARPLAPRSHRPRAIVYYRGLTRVGATRSTYEYFAVTH